MFSNLLHAIKKIEKSVQMGLIDIAGVGQRRKIEILDVIPNTLNRRPYVFKCSA
jgi:hypothetical protein